MQITKIIPGLLNNSFEFFNVNSEVKFVNNGTLKPFTDLPSSIHSLINQTIESNPEAKTILQEWHPNSEFHQLEKFISCRMGGLDFTPDITDGVLQEGEYWACPNIGNCKGQGILCKNPVYNGHELSSEEILLIQLSTTNKTNEAIADQLGKPLGTYHKMKKQIHEKLGNIQTKQCLTKIAYALNLI